jgi:alkanesulfonate monooxygenase SsuD/methylene tetrahydromethanopterin reductase-like flavin-dependent oxidoreductase (luciferase family)
MTADRFLDTWTSLVHLAERTRRISVMPNLADLALRAPAMVAKAAASLDVLTGGRVEIAVGAGGFADGIAAMGGPVRTPGESLQANIEGIRIVWAALEPAGRSRIEGRFNWTAGHEPGPRSVHHVSIWVGARRPRLFRAIGQLADGWVSPLSTYLPPEDLPAARAAIDHGAAEPVGTRPPFGASTTWSVGAIGTNGDGFGGSAEDWAQALAEWHRRLRLDCYIFWPTLGPGGSR